MEIDASTTTWARYRTTVAADRAGVLTPATALGLALVDRLRTQGFLFDVERLA